MSKKINEQQPSAGSQDPTQRPEAETATATETPVPAEETPAAETATASETETETTTEADANSQAEELRQAVLNGDFDISEFLSQYKTAQAEKDEAEAKALRLQADFDNYRRRSRADVEAAIHRAAADLIGSILPVVDNFDRAWQAMTEGPEKEGVALIHRQLLDVLRNAGLTEIEAAGAPFDPNLHHAVSQVEAGPENQGKVVQVLQKGYLLQDKLLRAAMVQVGI